MLNFIFDFDGTLADTRQAAVGATQQAFTEAGLAMPTAATVMGFMGVPIEVSFSQMANRSLNAEELRDLYETFRRGYRHLEATGITLFDQMAATLTALNARGDQLFVVSSKHSGPLERNLTQLGIRDHFKAIVGSDNVSHYKPAPDGILTLIDQFGLDPQACIMIGDAIYDIQMGKRAGVRTCAALWGANDPAAVRAEEPTYLLDAPTELLTIDY